MAAAKEKAANEQKMAEKMKADDKKKKDKLEKEQAQDLADKKALEEKQKKESKLKQEESQINLMKGPTYKPDETDSDANYFIESNDSNTYQIAQLDNEKNEFEANIETQSQEMESAFQKIEKQNISLESRISELVKYGKTLKIKET